MSKRNPKQISICIPAYKETKITHTLDSLANCEIGDLEVIVYILINGSSRDDRIATDTNLLCAATVEAWVDDYEGGIDFRYLVDMDLPVKHAGVGLARKILGDEAAHYYRANNMNGIIAYLDADCTIESNYFKALSEFFAENSYEAAAIHFEHPIQNVDEDLPIIEYESHLRYFIRMQHWTGFPFAYHTVGSSMAVLSESYILKGGMNKRKAGEDFYFLQKFIKDNLCGNLTKTIVYPSSRTSDRVPFGTGRAMLAYNDERYSGISYNPKSFLEIKKLIIQVKRIYENDIEYDQLHPTILNYIKDSNFEEHLHEIRRNVSSNLKFAKRFFQYFDAFRLMKCLHYLRDQDADFEDLPIKECLNWYFSSVLDIHSDLDITNQLLYVRKLDVNQIY